MSRETELKKKGIIRKDIDLRSEIIEKLTILAKKKGWTLKPFMEYVLFRESKKVK